MRFELGGQASAIVRAMITEPQAAEQPVERNLRSSFSGTES
jgi:hypothetical protein